MIYHNHHIIPTYDGGPDESSNIVRVNVKMHAFMHWQRYLQYGKEQDLIAARGLLGLVGKEQITEEQEKRRIKNSTEAIRKGFEEGRVIWNKGKTGIYSEETLNKLRRPRGKAGPRSNETKKKISESLLGIHKTDEHKRKLSDASRKYFQDPDNKKRHSDKLKERSKCPNCGLESNKSGITRHIRSGKCRAK